MTIQYTPEQLDNFENWVIETYKQGKLRSPVHLAGSEDFIQEKNLIKIFKNIKKQDWVFCTYRSHYHALLKGISEDWLKAWILNNKSIHVMNKEHRFFTSAIVAGHIPIALGVAMAIKMQKLDEHVYVFMGDMAARTGIMHECWSYALNFDLPITFIIEDNGLSTDTKTKEVWGVKNNELQWWEFFVDNDKYTQSFKFKRNRPHYGTGEFVDFNEDKK